MADLDGQLKLLGDQGACVNEDPGLFQLEEVATVGLSGHAFREAKLAYEEALSVAQGICAECPVLEACGNYAEAVDETSGVWAGVDRSRIRRPIPLPGEVLDWVVVERALVGERIQGNRVERAAIVEEWVERGLGSLKGLSVRQGWHSSTASQIYGRRAA